MNSDMYYDFMEETDAGIATWLLGVLSNLKPISEADGDQVIFQRAKEMLTRISSVDGIDPAMLDTEGEGRLRSTVENDGITEAYTRAFELGQCVTATAPDVSAYAAGYLLGLRGHGLVGLPGRNLSPADCDNVVHGMTVEVLLGDAGFTPPGDVVWGRWDGQVTDDGFADPQCADAFRRGEKAARDAADTYAVLRSLADDGA